MSFRETQQALGDLCGRGEKFDKQPKKADSQRARGRFLEYPEVLFVPSYLGADLPTPKYDKAVADAKIQDDVKTIFFVNFSSELEGDELTQQKEVQNLVQSWQAWCSTICEGKVQQQVDAKVLPDDKSGEFARSTYRAKVFDYVFRRGTWFAKTMDQNMSKHIECKKAEFHSNLLSIALEGLAIPTSVFPALEQVLKQISDGISLSTSSSGSEAQQYWIMLTKYDYLSITKTVQTTVRVISFQVSQAARTYSTNKASYESVSFDLSFSQYQADVNNEIFSQIKEKIDQKLIDEGAALVQQTTFDVPVRLR